MRPKRIKPEPRVDFSLPLRERDLIIANGVGAAIEDGKPFTAKQGPYLAFIYYYTKIHRTPPAEADFQRFFRVTPPVVHQMIKTLQAHGFIDRKPGKARSITLRLTRAQLPDLE
jgi:DNA-binding MarR family transcriptional regulator